MTLLQALGHFVSEAALNMKRSWRVSLLSILVTAVSLFLSGALFLLGSNLDASLTAWESQARIVVYMEPGAPGEAVDAVEQAISALEGVAVSQFISPEMAQERLRARSQDLEDLLEGLDGAPLPASFELELERSAAGEPQFESGILDLQNLAAVTAVDDDRHWIRQLAFASVLLRSGAAAVGLLLIAGSVFIIASVIRLAALLHREEIRVQRLVGATEFFVRGPFVIQGILQGALGTLLALLALSGFFFFLGQREIPDLIRTLLLSSYLSPAEQAFLLLFGTGAGLVGGLLSVRRTALGMW